jgi:hypothetical protein
MDDRDPVEAREEPSKATDLLESGRQAIRKYEFIGNRIVLMAQTLALLIVAIFFPLILIALVPNLIVYLLLTVVKIEEEIERPNEFIAGFKEGRFRK